MSTVLDEHRCAICEESIPADRAGVRLSVTHQATPNLRSRRWKAREVVCQHCAAKGYTESADLLRRCSASRWWRTTEPVDCEVCGLPVILQPDSRRKVSACSDLCRSRFYAARQPVTATATHPCEECGQLMAGRADRRFCSNACRQKAYRAAR